MQTPRQPHAAIDTELLRLVFEQTSVLIHPGRLSTEILLSFRARRPCKTPVNLESRGQTCMIVSNTRCAASSSLTTVVKVSFRPATPERHQPVYKLVSSSKTILASSVRKLGRVQRKLLEIWAQSLTESAGKSRDLSTGLLYRMPRYKIHDACKKISPLL